MRCGCTHDVAEQHELRREARSTDDGHEAPQRERTLQNDRQEALNVASRRAQRGCGRTEVKLARITLTQLRFRASCTTRCVCDNVLRCKLGF